MLENRDREIANLKQQLQQAQKERDAHKQRAEKTEKMLHESGSRDDAELEQWRKVIEQETQRADQAEKTSQDLQKRIQVGPTRNGYEPKKCLIFFSFLGYGETASATTEPNGSVSKGEGHSTAPPGRQGATKAEERAGEGARGSKELRHRKRKVTGPAGDAGAGVGEKPGFNKHCNKL